MSTLSKNFEPGQVEDKWYQWWLSRNYFTSKPDDRKPYTVVIPPPNVTGVLHMGHTLNETVQDVLIRKARMSGFNACWVPGSDHASIATEAKVVQMLEKEKGLKKQDISREEFLQYAFEWKEKYGGIIYHQIKRLGCSVDWDRVTFTMDDHYYKAVIKVFVDLYNKGKIYRGARMINWDPEAKTALSDEEVDYKDVQGKLYYIRYKVADENGKIFSNSPLGDGGIIIATQRPETIMGDTAVCVNPNDERYKHLKGKSVIVPLVNRKVPVIFDDYVDPSFGTGALKVTPAHDINDYNLGLKHNLQIIDTLNEDGTLSEAAEVFVGLDRFTARAKVIEQLRNEKLLVKEEEYNTRVGISQRTNAVVEPRISTQWFVKIKELAGKALSAVLSGDVKIHPEERFLATYKYWMENIKDWCISRQLWWGQRIPAYYLPNGEFIVAETKEEAFAQFKLQWTETSIHHSPFTIHDLKQDEDVLDTWFSSWLWPMEVFYGITKPGNPEINYYYPTNVLVTGQDIIFFWVARMIMAGMEYKNERPFGDVYFTGMVRDKQGRKMSKSLGNSPDLLQLIERFGADAVRFGILIAAPAGNDLLFDDSSCDQGRSFNNKIWNALKLVKMWEEKQSAIGNQQSANFAVLWFENRLNEVKQQVEGLYKQFRLSEALKIIYSLVWDDFCSWYLEWMKPPVEETISKEDYEKTIEFFEELLQLLHPFMPFVTEEIYHQLKERSEDLCVKQIAPISNTNNQILAEGKLLKDFITKIRNIRATNNLKNKETISLTLINKDYFDAHGNVINPQFPGDSWRGILKKQVNSSQINFNSIPNVTGTIVNETVEIFQCQIELQKLVDNIESRKKIQEEVDHLQRFLSSIEKKLSNAKFLQNAKPDVIAMEKKKRSDTIEKIGILMESITTISLEDFMNDESTSLE
jgi:valyl-tRNA synthetase